MVIAIFLAKHRENDQKSTVERSNTMILYTTVFYFLMEVYVSETIMLNVVCFREESEEFRYGSIFWVFAQETQTEKLRETWKEVCGSHVLYTTLLIKKSGNEREALVWGKNHVAQSGI